MKKTAKKKTAKKIAEKKTTEKRGAKPTSNLSILVDEGVVIEEGRLTKDERAAIESLTSEEVAALRSIYKKFAGHSHKSPFWRWPVPRKSCKLQLMRQHTRPCSTNWLPAYKRGVPWLN
mgnify:CR=1 FL=1